jgi:hypothetical protein
MAPTLTPTAVNTSTTIINQATATYTETISRTPTPLSSPTSIETPSHTPAPVAPTYTATTTNLPETTEKIPIPIPYPNPVSGNATIIHVQLSFPQAEENARLVLLSLNFRTIRDIDLGSVKPGEQTVSLPIQDISGANLANGVYYTAVITPRCTSVGKLLILR